MATPNTLAELLQLDARRADVFLPDALARKYPRTGQTRHHHVGEEVLQRALKAAMQKADIPRHASCHTLHRSFATHLPEDGYDIRTVRDLLGHADVRTTMIYTHVLNRGGRGVRSPLDGP